MNAKFDISGIRIETERLLLREFCDSDLNDVFEYASIDGVGERAGWPHHENIDITKKILSNFIKEKKTFAIVNKENNKVIGSIGIEPYGSEDKLTEFSNYFGREVGYVLSKDYWGKGLATEAVKAVIDYLFNSLNYDFLLCGYYDFNSQSKRVQEKCGFKAYRKFLFETNLGTKEPGVLNLLLNHKKNISLVFSHPETLIYKE
ncbi:MAG: GNAT family N-acetyltransferase [Bacilli bacterium]|nr:GNAT family N-acetyltransferase [Bacilli bacterium]